MSRRRVTDEEQRLLERALADVKPLRAKRRKAAKRGYARAEKAPASDAPVLQARRAPPRAVNAGKTATASPSRQAKPSPFVAGDPKIETRARRGRIAVERTLDLHGLTQDAAERRLTRFLKTAHSDGCRCVLIVTGKGGFVDRLSIMRGESPRGVIRSRFMDWVETNPLRALIARVAKAGPRHGGDGAFYVFLKA